MRKHKPVEVSFTITEDGKMDSCHLEGNVGAILTGFSACIAYFEEKSPKTADDMLAYMKTCIDKLKEMEVK